jgi:hypothetical protein
METKLTLKLDESIIEQAKHYAHTRKKSLSKLVEEYFRGLSSFNIDNNYNIHPLVKELSGIIKDRNIEEIDSEYATFLEKKYE